MRIAPARASATTSWSSGSDPQLGLLIDHSNGSGRRPSGACRRRSRRGSRAGHRDRRRGERERLVSAHEVEDDRGAASPRASRTSAADSPWPSRPHPPPPRAPVGASARAGPPRRSAPERARAAAARRRDRDRLPDHDDRRSRDEPGSSRLTARYDVSAASVNGAAPTGSSSPIGTSSRDDGTSTYSASPPS